MERTERSGNVDCARFIAAVLIMAHHSYHVGLEKYPFHEAWIYVEFFLLITGYYTAKHYEKNIVDNNSKEAITYTIIKFLPIFPYAFIATLCGWTTRGIYGMIFNPGWTWGHFIKNFMGDFIFDVLLISDSYGRPLIAPLWYISAMIIVFPIFCLIVQVKNRYTKIIVCSILPLLYYGWDGVNCKDAFPRDMLRCVIGMMLGAVIFEISKVFDEQIKGIPKSVLTLIEVISFAYPICCCYGNFAEKEYTTTRLYLLCFFVFLLICLPGYSYSAKIKGKFFNYLGKLSMPLFILSWYVGTLIYLIAGQYEWSNSIRITLYFSFSIIVSMLIMLLVDNSKKWNELLSKKIELKN